MKRERTTPESPKRGRGRPKGQPKTGGRVKRTRIQIARDKARDSIWDYVVKGLSGQAVKSRGPTGKQISQPLTEDNQIRLLQTAWRKLEPDLNATAVSADIVTEHVKTEPKDPRQVARAVLTVLEHAKLADEPSDPAAWPAPGQLMLGRDDVIEIAASDPRGVTAVALQGEASGHAELLDAAPDRNGAAREASSDHADASPESNDGADGERTIFDNGAEVIYDAELGKFAVLDSGGELHGYRRSRALAETFAATLPGPAAMTAVGQKRT